MIAPKLRRLAQLFSAREGSRLVWGPCYDCGRNFGVTQSEVALALKGDVVCRDCSPPVLLDKAAVLTERQRHGCRSTR